MFFLFLFQLLSFIHYVTADMEPEIYEYYNNTSGDNIIAASLWAMGVCSCVSLVCKHKKQLPVTVTPLEHHWKDDKTYYQIESKDGTNLKEFKKNIDELNNIVDYLIVKEEDKEFNQLKYEKGVKDNIEPQLRFLFGEGEIQYEENGKYYHGIGMNERYKWNKGNKWDKRFCELIQTKKVNKFWDTHNATTYCQNCSFDEEFSKRKKVYKVYRCNGHELNDIQLSQ